MKTLLKRAEKLLEKSFKRMAAKNPWKNMDYNLWNDEGESGSFHDQSYITSDHDEDYEEYPKEVPYEEGMEFNPREFYSEDDEESYDDFDLPVDKQKLKESYNIMQDVLDLLVKYFGNVSMTIRKFHETTVNEELENNDIIQRIEKFLKELYSLDKIIKQYEGESLERLGKNAVENMDRIMDACKDIFEKIKTLQEILGFEEPMLQSAEMQPLKKVISDVRKINDKVLNLLDDKFEEYDSMDITIKQVYSPKEKSMKKVLEKHQWPAEDNLEWGDAPLEQQEEWRQKYAPNLKSYLI